MDDPNAADGEDRGATAGTSPAAPTRGLARRTLRSIVEVASAALSAIAVIVSLYAIRTSNQLQADATEADRVERLRLAMSEVLEAQSNLFADDPNVVQVAQSTIRLRAIEANELMGLIDERHVSVLEQAFVAHMLTLSGVYGEAETLSQQALDRAEDPFTRAEVLPIAMANDVFIEEYARAEERLDEAIRIIEATPYPTETGRVDAHSRLLQAWIQSNAVVGRCDEAEDGVRDLEASLSSRPVVAAQAIPLLRELIDQCEMPGG